VDLNLTPAELRFRDEVRVWFTENVPRDWVKRRDEEESMLDDSIVCASGRGNFSTPVGLAFRGPRTAAGAARR